jgi:hypothetical protein
MCKEAGFLVCLRSSARWGVLLVGLARRTTWRVDWGVHSRVIHVGSNLQPAGRSWRVGLLLRGRSLGREQLHSIIEDVREVERARWVVTFAWAALGGLARADEGLLRGRARAIHLASTSVEWRRHRELRVASVAV